MCMVFYVFSLWTLLTSKPALRVIPTPVFRSYRLIKCENVFWRVWVEKVNVNSLSLMFYLLYVVWCFVLDHRSRCLGSGVCRWHDSCLCPSWKYVTGWTRMGQSWKYNFWNISEIIVGSRISLGHLCLSLWLRR